MSVKTERIGNHLLKEISQILRFEARNEYLKLVTLTHVQVTSDLTYAKIYYNILNTDNKQKVQKALEKSEGYIKTELAHRIDIRHIPSLHFVYDESIEYGEKIEKLIEENKK